MISIHAIIKNGAKASWFAAVPYPLAKANGNRYEIASQIFVIAFYPLPSVLTDGFESLKEQGL